MNTMEKIYLAMWNSCIYESSSTPIKAFKTQESAQKCIDEHKAERVKHWEDIFSDDSDKVSEVEDAIAMEHWHVQEMEIND